MKKKSLLRVLLSLIFVIVFNLVFFIVGGTEQKPSVWLSYGFIHLSYVLVLLSPALCSRKGGNPNASAAVATISGIYFAVSFITALIFIFLKPDSMKAPLITQIILCGIYLVILFVTLLVDSDSAEQSIRHEYETAFIKTSASRLKLLMGQGNDTSANKAIEKAFDSISCSPTRSSQDVSIIESSISQEISRLESAVQLGETDNVINISKKIIALSNERNIKLKTNI